MKTLLITIYLVKTRLSESQGEAKELNQSQVVELAQCLVDPFASASDNLVFNRS